MLSAIASLLRRLPLSSGRARALLAAVVVLLTVVAFLARRFRGTGGGDGKITRGGERQSRSLKDKGASSSSPSSSSRRQRHGSGSSTGSKRHHSKKPDSSLPSMYVLVGIHGSGKSLWAKQFVEKVRKSAIIVSSDTVRAAVTGSIDDYSREEEVEERFLREIEHHIQLRRTIVVDDCHHNIDPVFRMKLLDLAPESEYNRILRRFPIKTVFARTRIDKDLAEGRRRYDPQPLEMEQLLAKYDAVDAAIKSEGWLQDK